MYFYLIVALQVYCMYHCYVNKNQYYWIFIVLFLPALGSIFYLFLNVFQKHDIEKVQEGISTVINPSKKITDLEKKLEFAETFENRVALADAYFEAGIFDKAEEEYKTSLVGTFENDYYVNTQLLKTYFYSSQYEAVLRRAESIKESSKFNKSEASFLYGLTLEKTGDTKLAEDFLIRFDAPYSRYEERLELAKFYIRNGSVEKARTILKEINQESIGMSKISYRQYKEPINNAKELLESVLKS